MRHLGIDYGSKRIGLALSDEAGSVAFPHSVIPAGPGSISAVVKLIKQEAVGRVVMGESRDFKGNANPIMKDIAWFKEKLETEAGVPVVFEAEFLTSAAASRIQGERADIDASAAALILQSYLDRNR